jgi:hypothetical protein
LQSSGVSQMVVLGKPTGANPTGLVLAQGAWTIADCFSDNCSQ